MCFWWISSIYWRDQSAARERELGNVRREVFPLTRKTLIFSEIKSPRVRRPIACSTHKSIVNQRDSVHQAPQRNFLKFNIVAFFLHLSEIFRVFQDDLQQCNKWRFCHMKRSYIQNRESMSDNEHNKRRVRAAHNTHGGGGTAEWRWKTNDTFFQFFTLLFFCVIFLSLLLYGAVPAYWGHIKYSTLGNLVHYQNLIMISRRICEWIFVSLTCAMEYVMIVWASKKKMCILWTESYGEKNWQEPAVNYDWVAQSARPMYSLRFNYLERFGGLFCLLSRQHRMSGPFPSTTTWNVLSKIIREELPCCNPPSHLVKRWGKSSI